jgi:hypothetical protein
MMKRVSSVSNEYNCLKYWSHMMSRIYRIMLLLFRECGGSSGSLDVTCRCCGEMRTELSPTSKVHDRMRQLSSTTNPNIDPATTKERIVPGPLRVNLSRDL